MLLCCSFVIYLIHYFFLIVCALAIISFRFIGNVFPVMKHRNAAEDDGWHIPSLGELSLSWVIFSAVECNLSTHNHSKANQRSHWKLKSWFFFVIDMLMSCISSFCLNMHLGWTGVLHHLPLLWQKCVTPVELTLEPLDSISSYKSALLYSLRVLFNQE